MNIRSAKVSDVKEMQALINDFAARKEMLPRSLNDLYENIFEYFVAEDDAGKVIGCGALHIAWEDLAEVKGLAVASSMHGKGIGAQIVRRAEQKALEVGVRKVFALTFKPGFFEKLGYKQVGRETLPHKVWGECVKCPMFPDCGEVAVMKTL